MSFLGAKGKEATMLMAMVGSYVVGIIVAIVAQPWSDWLGPSFSASRLALSYVVSALMYLIPGLIAMLLFAENQEWLAPPGKYTPDIEYKPFSPYILTAAAIVGAVYAVGGILTGINVDVPALITSFSATYFGPIVCFLGIFFGFFVRYAIGGAAWLATPLLIPEIAWIDAGVWSLASYIYWLLVRKLGKGVSGAMRLVYFIIGLIEMVVLHVIGWIFVYAFTLNPWEAFIGYITFAFSTWYPTTIVFVLIGAVIGESVYYSRTSLMEVE